MSVQESPAYDRVTDALRSAGLRVTVFGQSTRAQCPHHQSRGLTLSITPDARYRDGGPLAIFCHAGCDTADVLAELGLTLRDLYDGDRPPDWKPAPVRQASPWDRIPDPEHFADRAIQQTAIENDPAYWERMADELEAALPRPGDFPGTNPHAAQQYDDAAWLAGRSPTVRPRTIPGQVRRVQAQIQACRNKAEFLRMYGDER